MTFAWVGGAALGLIGAVLIVANGRKLIADWPRPKPVHNVDLAWIQVYVGLALVCAAWFLVADPARALWQETPVPMPTENGAAPEPPANGGRR